MLRIVQRGNDQPIQYPVDPNAEFQHGMIGQLKVIGNNIVCGVSDGTAPLGILDDIRTNAFTSVALDEVVIVQAVGVDNGSGTLISAADIKTELANPNIVSSSFTTSLDVQLIARNGVIIIPQGTPLNFDADGDGIPDSFRVVVSYTYQIPNVPGDDSTQGSGRVTLWYTRILFQTDQFETNQRYPINSNLFVSEAGLLTTRQPSANHPAVAIVTGSPTNMLNTIEALWL